MPPPDVGVRIRPRSGESCVVVESLEQKRRQALLVQSERKRRLRRRKQFVDQSLRKRLGRVDEDELSALLGDLLGDERVDEDRELLDARVSDRGGALLAIDDPAGALLLVQRDHQRPALAAERRRLAARAGSKRTRESKATTIPFGIIGVSDSM